MSKTVPVPDTESRVSDSSGSQCDLVEAICDRLQKLLGDETIPVRRVWLTPDEAAAYLAVHPVWLAKLRSGGLPGPRFYAKGRVVRYHIQDLDAFMRGDDCPREATDGQP